MQETITFLGEHLWIGNLGHLFVVLATLSALGASIFYFLSDKNPSFLGISRTLLKLHIFSVLGIIVTLFAIIYNHWFEYQYAWQHSSADLPWYYMISCFWEGQEGSFLLWMFWHCVLCLILLRKAREWEAPVLAIVTLVQFALGGMLLGIHFHIGETLITLGSSPFELLRTKNPALLQIPVLQTMGKANYLHAIQDGNGLNPLLQNYWMVIHPPTLFSGFACTVIPFAYAVAGLWKNKTKEWITPALPYVIITVMVLGTGIIMGGYWAYESLSFGGYWAWDPVENASLMPWVIMVVTLHMLLISKARGTYVGLSTFLAITSFIMVLYATFLTRSGILGDTSVHAFVSEGLNGQLLFFLFLFMAIGYGLYLIRTIQNKINPGVSSNEKISSREFWMFIGSLVLVLSLLHIIGATSIPVYNKILGTNIAPHTDPIAYYNTWQTPFALVILLIMAGTQFLRYRDTPSNVWLKPIVISLAISLVVSLALSFAFDIRGVLYWFFLFATVYAVTANVLYIFQGLKGKFSHAGASIAHSGFAIMLLGVLVSSVNKHVISYNNTGSNYMREDAENNTDKMKAISFNRENILLQKNEPVVIADYTATYVGDTFISPNKYYRVRYQKFDKETKVLKDEFVLEPSAQFNEKMGGLISSPDTRHYLSRDVFTHVNHESGLDKEQEWRDPLMHTVKEGDTFTTVDALHKLVLLGVEKEGSEDGKLVAIKPRLSLTTISGNQIISPSLILDLEKIQTTGNYDESTEIEPVVLNEDGLKIELTRIILADDVKNVQLVFKTMQRAPKVDYIILKAIVFPWINLVWLGTLVMFLGFMIAIVRRVKDYNKTIA